MCLDNPAAGSGEAGLRSQEHFDYSNRLWECQTHKCHNGTDFAGFSWSFHVCATSKSVNAILEPLALYASPQDWGVRLQAYIFIVKFNARFSA